MESNGGCRWRQLQPGRRHTELSARSTLTVWDWAFWLASITAVRGTVSSSSTLPEDGFSMTRDIRNLRPADGLRTLATPEPGSCRVIALLRRSDWTIEKPT
ncbi:PX domain-containing protein kinase-like protein [Takifugu flavidus]|uniref:PX domain-containing protein kinase-like protein n=1 Tax=Takifugu flavidus TaxID=433684 RepID=A0A5C6N7W9_9TELE|nr:PX domain-containing protein kinase-like protein [Takifugu flavidus]